MKQELSNKQFEFKRFLRSFKYSWEGIKYAYLHEQSMFIHALATILSILLGLILNINRYEWIIIIALLCVIAVIELLNTAIEAVCDCVTKEFHSLIKIAKDTASASAFIASIVGLIVGLIIFIPYIVSLF